MDGNSVRGVVSVKMLEHCERADMAACLRLEYPANPGALLGWMCDRKELAHQIGIPFPPESIIGPGHRSGRS
ncbi:MAG TPA: hypothetical protein VN517_08930 [Terriglobales bacterium]|nr:hypothetical protein [Terriglobales bacterium]